MEIDLFWNHRIHEVVALAKESPCEAFSQKSNGIRHTLQWQILDFPGGRQPLRGAPTYYLTNFSQKLHENKEILAGGASLAPPRSTNAWETLKRSISCLLCG